MYRIRSASGTETVYGSLEEFAAAVKRGEVTPEAEIFHTRANRWLDIKTHPHYRIAMGLAQGTGPGPKHSEPVAAASPSRPAPSLTSRGESRPGGEPVVERPPVRPGQGQTTARPALNSSPAAAIVESPRPEKTRELTFIELDDKPKSSPAPPAGRNDPIPGTELSFLSPERGSPGRPVSSGNAKTVPGDLDLLFDSADSLQAEPPRPKPALAAPKGVVAPRPEPRPQAVARFPAVKPPEPRKPEVSGPGVPSPQTRKPVASDSEAAPREGVPPEAPHVDAAKREPEKPPAALETMPAPVAPVKPEPAQFEPPAAPVGGLKTEPTSEDLEIPPFSVREAAVHAAAHATPPPAVPGRKALPVPLKLLAGSVAGAALLGAVLLAWRPWGGSVAAASVTAQPVAGAPVRADSAPPAPPAPNTPSAEALAGTGRSAPAASGPAAPTGTTGEASQPAAGAEEERILAAARPTFRTQLDLSAAQVSITPENLGRPETATPPSELARRFEAAQQQAQQDLLSRLNAIGFNRVLAPGRLGSSEAVTAARSAWNQGAEAIRQYRGRIARIADAYEDSLLASQRSRKWPAEEMRSWSARQSLAEPAELTQLSDLMFTQVNEALEILGALSGAYQLRGNTIAFKNPSSATRYTSIRNWVAQRLEAWAGLPESARPVTITQILRALGDGLPAAE